MILQHCRLVENELEAKAKKAGVFDHPDNLGAARECFVREFLKDNLPAKTQLWTGEIIDHTINFEDTERRKQVDVAIARDDVPAFRIGGDKYLMPCEAVLATVEVKSRLTKAHFFNALDAIQHWRKLRRLPTSGFALVRPNFPNRILNYIFAFDGPTIDTLAKYMEEYARSRGVSPLNLFDLCIVLRRFTIAPNNETVLTKFREGAYAWLEQKQDNLAALMAALFTGACAFTSTPPEIGGYFAGRPPSPDRVGSLDFTAEGLIQMATGAALVPPPAPPPGPQTVLIENTFVETPPSSALPETPSGVRGDN
jgi:hypothetical protein